MRDAMGTLQEMTSPRNTRQSTILSRKRQLPLALQIFSIDVNGYEHEEILDITSQVHKMGGEFREELRQGTTHLVCETAGSPMHRAACNWNARSSTKNIIIVRRAWLDACEKASMCVSHSSYVLLPLTGFNICCSGFEIAEKEQIGRFAHDLGATYRKCLGEECTHLICFSPSGQKYNFAIGGKNIFVTRVQWLYESSRLNVLLDETRFSFEEGDPRESRGSYGTEVTASAVNNSTADPHSNGLEPVLCRWQDASPGNTLDAVTMFFPPSSLRDNDKYAPLRAKALQLANIGGASVSSELTENVNYIVILRLPVAPSILPSIQRAQDCGTVKTTLEWLEDCILHQRLLSTKKYQTPEFSEVFLPDSSQPSSQVQVVTSSLFLGVRMAVGPITIRDPSAAYSICSRVASGNAKILAHDAAGYVTSGTPTHVLCPHDVIASEMEMIRDAQSKNQKVLKVTQFWVDMCILANSLLHVPICALFTPVLYETPLADMTAQKVCLSISGFRIQNEQDWNRRREVLKRLAVMLGAKCTERMRRRQTNYLMADSRNGDSEKVKKAREWGIKVVTHEWILACARAGKVVGAEGYALGTDVTPGRSPASKSEVQRKEVRSGRKSNMPDAAAISLFQRLSEKFDEAAGEEDEPNKRGLAIRDSVKISKKSKSVSRDGLDDERSWSMEASQSQMIVHRDLTPPPSPTQKLKRARLTL